MATFSENQVRHFYIVNDGASLKAGKSGNGFYMTLPSLNADGKEVRTDMVENVMYAKATKSGDMTRKTTVIKITMNPDALSTAGDPIFGEDYTLSIRYSQFIAQSDEVFYHDFASAHATSKSTVSSVLLDLAKNLAKNIKAQGMVEVTVETATGEKALSAVTDSDVISALYIKEIEQPWTLGTKQQTPVLFTVNMGTVVFNGDELEWGIATPDTTKGTVIENGKTIADMEYFYLGERADQYRNMGWPNVWETKYAADAAKAYDTIDIHYAYVGANHAVQKSEKTITIACPNDGSHTEINKVLATLGAVAPGMLPTNL